MEPLEEAELAQLAPKVSVSSMKSIAIQRMGFTAAEISSLVSEYREDTEGFRRQILTHWRNKNRTDSRQVSLNRTTPSPPPLRVWHKTRKWVEKSLTVYCAKKLRKSQSSTLWAPTAFSAGKFSRTTLYGENPPAKNGFNFPKITLFRQSPTLKKCFQNISFVPVSRVPFAIGLWKEQPGIPLHSFSFLNALHCYWCFFNLSWCRVVPIGRKVCS